MYFQNKNKRCFGHSLGILGQYFDCLEGAFRILRSVSIFFLDKIIAEIYNTTSVFLDTLGSVCALRLGIRCVFVCLKLYHWVAKSGWSVLSLAENPEREENNPGLIDVRRRRSLLLGDPKFDLFPNL